jgi:hypothetical protein
MALLDDLNHLAQQDVVYLTKMLTGAFPGSTTIYRGRLHQALSGNWVFNTSTGQNGVAGINLGAAEGNWASDETPAGGIKITISYMIAGAVPPQVEFAVLETITLMSVIPADLAD